jgi:hypothetical protein
VNARTRSREAGDDALSGSLKNLWGQIRKP